MADPDIEAVRRGPGFVLLALPAFLPSLISSCFTQNKGVGGWGARSSTSHTKLDETYMWF